MPLIDIKDVKELFAMIPHGTTVVIVQKKHLLEF